MSTTELSRRAIAGAIAATEREAHHKSEDAANDRDIPLRAHDPIRVGGVYIFFAPPSGRHRKARWFIFTEFCDCSNSEFEFVADREAAISLAKSRAQKYNFRIVDMSAFDFGGRR